jgi:PhnB protein
MPSVETYLTFNGNCRDAVRFYEQTLGANVELMMTHGESPMAAQAPADFKDQIMHSSLRTPYNGMHGFTLSLNYESTAEGEKIFNALAAGGKVVMPYQETFWVERWGACVDKFGTPWMVNAGESKMG